MIGGGEAEARAVAGAVKSAVGQVRVDAGVYITGLLADIDMADDLDFRQHFMCWHLTRVLGPSLTEMVPPAVVRGLAGRETVQMHCETPDWPQLDGDWAAMVNCTVSAGLPWPMESVTATGNEQSRAGCGYLRLDDRYRSDRVLSVGPATSARSSRHRELLAGPPSKLVARGTRRAASLRKQSAGKRMLHRSLATPPSPPARRAASTTWFLNVVSA